MNLSAEQIVWLITGIASLALVIAVLLIGRRGNRTSTGVQRQSKFGPDYDKAVQSSRSHSRDLVTLSEPSGRNQNPGLRELSSTQRDQYSQWWAYVQSLFAEHPATALTEADRLATNLMRDRGYPAPDRNDPNADLNPRHAHLVTRLHRAQELRRTGSSAQQKREALLAYRGVIAELLALDLRTSQERQTQGHIDDGN